MTMFIRNGTTTSVLVFDVCYYNNVSYFENEVDERAGHYASENTLSDMTSLYSIVHVFVCSYSRCLLFMTSLDGIGAENVTPLRPTACQPDVRIWVTAQRVLLLDWWYSLETTWLRRLEHEHGWAHKHDSVHLIVQNVKEIISETEGVMLY